MQRKRTFPTVESQAQASEALNRRLRVQRLRRAGCSEAMVIAFTAARLERYPAGSIVAPAYPSSY